MGKIQAMLPPRSLQGPSRAPSPKVEPKVEPVRWGEGGTLGSKFNSTSPPSGRFTDAPKGCRGARGLGNQSLQTPSAVSRLPESPGRDLPLPHSHCRGWQGGGPTGHLQGRSHDLAVASHNFPFPWSNKVIGSEMGT